MQMFTGTRQRVALQHHIVCSLVTIKKALEFEELFCLQLYSTCTV